MGAYTNLPSFYRVLTQTYDIIIIVVPFVGMKDLGGDCFLFNSE